MYSIPAGVGDDLFTVDSTGIVTTRGAIDRENKDLFTIPIYVSESSASDLGNKFGYGAPKTAITLFDVATLVIKGKN